MVTGALPQDETQVVIALNILAGNVNPEQWRGLRRVDEDEEAVLSCFNEVRQWGFGKLEVSVLNHKFDTAHETKTRKRKDLINR